MKALGSSELEPEGEQEEAFIRISKESVRRVKKWRLKMSGFNKI